MRPSFRERLKAVVKSGRIWADKRSWDQAPSAVKNCPFVVSRIKRFIPAKYARRMRRGQLGESPMVLSYLYLQRKTSDYQNMDEAPKAKSPGGRIAKCISQAKQLSDLKGYSRELRKLNVELKRTLETMAKRKRVYNETT